MRRTTVRTIILVTGGAFVALVVAGIVTSIVDEGDGRIPPAARARFERAIDEISDAGITCASAANVVPEPVEPSEAVMTACTTSGGIGFRLEVFENVAQRDRSIGGTILLCFGTSDLAAVLSRPWLIWTEDAEGLSGIRKALAAISVKVGPPVECVRRVELPL